MSYRSTIHDKVLNLAAGERRELEIGIADFLFFNVFPSGLTVSINDLAPVAVPEGFLTKGPPGQGNFRALTLLNPTAGPLAARVLYGLGDITVAGAVALIGSVPLPAGASTLAEQVLQTARLNSLIAAQPLPAGASTLAEQVVHTARLNSLISALPLPAGASTAAKQDAQTAALAPLATAAKQDAQTAALTSVVGVISTAARQDAQTAQLNALTAANTDTPQVINQGANTSTVYTNCKSFSLLNTGAGDVVVTANGIAGNIPAGYGVDFPLSKPLNLLAAITVTTGAGGAALIALTL